MLLKSNNLNDIFNVFMGHIKRRKIVMNHRHIIDLTRSHIKKLNEYALHLRRKVFFEVVKVLCLSHNMLLLCNYID